MASRAGGVSPVIVRSHLGFLAVSSEDGRGPWLVAGEGACLKW